MKKILITRKLIKESEEKAVKTFKPNLTLMMNCTHKQKL